jgi:hypothetical protein
MKKTDDNLLIRYAGRYISRNNSAVPTGLPVEALASPGTEVPGYSLCVPDGTHFSGPSGSHDNKTTMEGTKSHFPILMYASRDSDNDQVPSMRQSLWGSE